MLMKMYLFISRKIFSMTITSFVLIWFSYIIIFDIFRVSLSFCQLCKKIATWVKMWADFVNQFLIKENVGSWWIWRWASCYTMDRGSIFKDFNLIQKHQEEGFRKKGHKVWKFNFVWFRYADLDLFLNA